MFHADLEYIFNGCQTATHQSREHCRIRMTHCSSPTLIHNEHCPWGLNPVESDFRSNTSENPKIKIELEFDRICQNPTIGLDVHFELSDQKSDNDQCELKLSMRDFIYGFNFIPMPRFVQYNIKSRSKCSVHLIRTIDQRWIGLICRY